MATYKDVIDQVEIELRTLDAFPDASTKLAEQIDAVYRYAVALQKSLPLQNLKVIKVELSKQQAYKGLLSRAELPQNINKSRADFGIAEIIIDDGIVDEEILTIDELTTFSNLKKLASNSYHADRLIAAMNPSASYLYMYSFVDSASIKYSPAQQLATTGDYASVDINLDDNSVSVLVEAVCAHFSSVNAKDFSSSQIHSTLSQILKE